MRAAVCRAFGAPLAIEELTLAPPGPGEVAVAVEACAVCHSDIAYAAGAWGGALPAVYGHEAAGRVAAVGAGVRGFRRGRPGARHADPRLRRAARPAPGGRPPPAPTPGTRRRRRFATPAGRRWRRG